MYFVVKKSIHAEAVFTVNAGVVAGRTEELDGAEEFAHGDVPVRGIVVAGVEAAVCFRSIQRRHSCAGGNPGFTVFFLLILTTHRHSRAGGNPGFIVFFLRIPAFV